jgi:hypothetical protein
VYWVGIEMDFDLLWIKSDSIPPNPHGLTQKRTSPKVDYPKHSPPRSTMRLSPWSSSLLHYTFKIDQITLFRMIGENEKSQQEYFVPWHLPFHRGASALLLRKWICKER